MDVGVYLILELLVYLVGLQTFKFGKFLLDLNLGDSNCFPALEDIWWLVEVGETLCNLLVIVELHLFQKFHLYYLLS